MKLKVGDEVKYASQWLHNTGQYTGEIPFARGVIVSLSPLGGGSDHELAEVDWGDHKTKVVTPNLWPIDKMHLEPR